MYNECTLGHAVLFDASLLNETINGASGRA